MYHNCYVNENSHSGPIPSNSNLSNFSNCSSCQRVSWGILGETLRSVGRLSERFVVVFMWWWWRWPSWSLEIGVAQYFFVSFDKVLHALLFDEIDWPIYYLFPVPLCAPRPSYVLLLYSCSFYMQKLILFEWSLWPDAGDTVTIEGITALVERFGSVAFVRLILGLKNHWGGWDGDETWFRFIKPGSLH